MQYKWDTIFNATNDQGFTFIELIAVLALLAILTTVSLPKFIDLGANASQQSLIASVAELNSREMLTWAKIKNSDSGWINDDSLFSQIDTDLGSYYHWSPKAVITGGILHFKNQMVKLDRLPSTVSSAGRWEITFSSD